MALKEVQRTARRRAVSQTRTRALGINTQQGDQRLEIMDALSKFAQAGSAEANRQQRAEIETKKALGASRAAQDLLKTEEHRQGITEDDALATKLSYNAVVGKHETMNAGNDFAEWFTANPSATDEEIEAKKTELYQPLFEKYGDDDRSLKQISLQVQESQFSLLPIQEKIRANYTTQKNTEALNMSIGDLLADPSADVDAIVNDELPERAKALGLDEFTLKKSIMQEMVTRASEGDGRLLEQLKKTDWAKNSVLINKADNAYQQYTSRENAIEIGDQLGSIEIQNKSLSVPWETTLKQVEALNKRFPNSVSAAKVAQMKQARAAATKKESNNTGMMKSSFGNLKDPDGIPLALDNQYTSEDKKDFVKELDKLWADKATQLVESGDVSQEKANAVIMKEKLDWSRVNRIKIPSLAQNLEGLVGLNPEDYPEGQGLPEFAQTGLQILKNMDAATVDIYFTGRDDKAFVMNIKKGMETRGEYSAFKRAFNVRQNPYRATQENRTDVLDEVTTQVDKKFTYSWVTEKLTGAQDVPEWQLAQIRSRVGDVATTNMYSGMLDAESNAEQSLAEVTKDYSPTFNGTLINVPKAKLAETMSTDEVKVPVAKVDSYIEGFTLASLDMLSAEHGSEVSPEDVSLDFSANGTFVFRYKGGEQLGGRFTQQEIFTVGRQQDLQKLRDLQTESLEERNARLAEEKKAQEDAAHMALFYKEWGESLNQ